MNFKYFIRSKFSCEKYSLTKAAQNKETRSWTLIQHRFICMIHDKYERSVSRRLLFFPEKSLNLAGNAIKHCLPKECRCGTLINEEASLFMMDDAP